jgi:hypothetical protein
VHVCRGFALQPELCCTPATDSPAATRVSLHIQVKKAAPRAPPERPRGTAWRAAPPRSGLAPPGAPPRTPQRAPAPSPHTFTPKPQRIPRSSKLRLDDADQGPTDTLARPSVLSLELPPISLASESRCSHRIADADGRVLRRLCISDKVGATVFARARICLIVALGAALVAVWLPGSAAASVAYRYWSNDPTGSTDWMGERVTVGAPTASQRNINPPDSQNTSIWAANNKSDGDGRGLQQGVHYTYNNIEDPGCDTQGVGSPAMFNFVEFYDYGNYECWYESDASGGALYDEKLLKNSSNYWQEFLNGSYQGHQILWSSCGGNACLLQTFGEDVTDVGGGELWQAKFDGSQTPWAQYNGTVWGKITNTPKPYIGNLSWWSKDMTNFPDGLWWFLYSH